MTQQHEDRHEHEDRRQHEEHGGGGGGAHVHGVDPSDPQKRATPGGIIDQAGLEGSAAPGEIRNPIVPPDARPGD